jgi:hypothetical protein
VADGKSATQIFSKEPLMWGHNDINTPTQYHMRLLAQKDFDFTPFWEEAVVNWLHRNSSRLLKVNPHCCKHYIGDAEQKSTIANVIPMTDDADIIQFIRSLSAEDAEVFDDLAVRLIEAGKIDLIVRAKLSPFLAMEKERSGEQDASQVLNVLTGASLLEILDTMNWGECKWDEEAYGVLISRLPTERLKDVAVERIPPWMRRSYRRGSPDTPVHKARNRTACLLANILPKEDLRDFIGRFSGVATMMDCMACGELTAKSKPGYTLHRKACDPSNRYPNALIMAATRLL